MFVASILFASSTHDSAHARASVPMRIVQCEGRSAEEMGDKSAGERIREFSQRRMTRPVSVYASDGSLASFSKICRGFAGCLGIGRRWFWADVDRSSHDRSHRGDLASISDRKACAAPSDIPASLAITRRETPGRLAMISRARWRPSSPRSGRTRPSQPTRMFMCGLSAVELRALATVLAERPEILPIARSDRCGWDRTIR